MSVTEDGVEASAATGIAITLYSFFEPETELKVDRPFLAFVVNDSDDSILFAGAVNDPTKG